MAFALQSRPLRLSTGVAPAAPVRAIRTRTVVPRAALELKSPPYALDALEPHMSKQTLEFHWGALMRTAPRLYASYNACPDDVNA